MGLDDDIQRGILGTLGVGLVLSGQPVAGIGGLLLIAFAWRKPH
jgi:hypothetical protein